MSKTTTEKRPAIQGEPSKAQWTWREMKKNKVAYVPYHNLKAYFISRVWYKFHRIPVNHQERFVESGYKHVGIRHCVFCMPIPLRVC